MLVERMYAPFTSSKQYDLTLISWKNQWLPISEAWTNRKYEYMWTQAGVNETSWYTLGLSKYFL